MANSKKRRDTHRATVVPGDVTSSRRARLVIDVESIATDDGRRLDMRTLTRWFDPVTEFGNLLESHHGAQAAILVDRFAFRLHLGDSGAEVDGAHAGDDFLALALDAGVEVYVTAGLDPRRASEDDLSAAAASGSLVAALVPAFEVHEI